MDNKFWQRANKKVNQGKYNLSEKQLNIEVQKNLTISFRR